MKFKNKIDIFLKILKFYEIFEILQYTYRVQIQGYIARFFSIESNRKILITIVNIYIYFNNKKNVAINYSEHDAFLE